MHNLAIYAELRMVGRGGSSPATPAIFYWRFCRFVDFPDGFLTKSPHAEA